MKLTALLLPSAIALLAPFAALALDPLDVPGPCWMRDGRGRMVDLGEMCDVTEAETEEAGATTTPAQAAAPEAVANPYPQEAIDAFVQGCNSSGGNDEFCGCAIAEVQNRYTLDEFVAISAGSSPDGEPSAEMQTVMNEVTSACVSALLPGT
jgi:hypothetical protein